MESTLPPSSTPISLSESFYVGDAAGRYADPASSSVVRKDHSACDRTFAMNLNLTFYTPEEYFLGIPPQDFHLDFNPHAFLQQQSTTTLDIEALKLSETLEIIVFVGFPGCGKSTFVGKHLLPTNHFHVSQDKLKSKEKCFAAATESLKRSQSVVVDGTHPNLTSRRPWIELGKQFSIPVRCFAFQASEQVSKHNNLTRSVRQCFPNIKMTQSCPKVPTIAYNIYKSKYEEPSVGEGFASIHRIDFVGEFETEAERGNFLHFYS